MIHLASGYLTGSATGDAVDATPPPDRTELIVHLDRDLTSDAPALSASLEDGSRVSAETLRRVACDGGVVAAAVDERAGVLDVGRRTRAIPSAIRRALAIRDQGCRFPGCTNTRCLHGHHVRHWLHGGRTALDNLVLLCSFHHRAVHEGGFAITIARSGEVTVRTPEGDLLPACPGLAPDPGVVDWGDLDWFTRSDPMPVPSWDGESPDYDEAVGSLVAA